MLNIMRVIARLLGVQTQSLETPAQPTPTVGRASQTRTRKVGSKPSAHNTKHQPAQSKPKRKSKAAPSTKVVALQRQEQKAVPAESGETGKQ